MVLLSWAAVVERNGQLVLSCDEEVAASADAEESELMLAQKGNGGGHWSGPLLTW